MRDKIKVWSGNILKRAESLITAFSTDTLLNRKQVENFNDFNPLYEDLCVIGMLV